MTLVEDIRDIRRPLRDIPEDSLACDLLWADPYEGKGFAANDRGVSHVFGKDVVRDITIITAAMTGAEIDADSFTF